MGVNMGELLRRQRTVPVATCRSLFEHEVNTHYGAENQAANGTVGRDVFTDFQDVVVRAGEQLFAQSRPFFGDMRELLITGQKAKVPARPFALEFANWLVLGPEYRKGSANGEELLLKAPNRDCPPSNTSTLERKSERPRFTLITGSPAGVRMSMSKGVIRL